MTDTRLFSRSVIRLAPAGNDVNVSDFLQPLITKDLSGYFPIWTGFLDESGKVLYDVLVWPGGYGLLLDCEEIHADELLAFLEPICAAGRVLITRDDGVAVYIRTHAGDGAASDPRHQALGQRWIARASPDDRSADDLWQSWRLSLGVAEGRDELGFGELDWLACNALELHGVDFRTFTFPGKEILLAKARLGIGERLVVVPTQTHATGMRRFDLPDISLSVELRDPNNTPLQFIPDWMKAGIGRLPKT